MDMRTVNIKKYWVYAFLLFFLTVPLLSAPHISWSGLFLALFIFISYKFKLPKFPIALFIISFVLRAAVVLCIKTPLQSDFSTMYNASQGVLVNDFSFLKDDYFKYWPYQIGFVVYQSILLRICNKILFLKLVNCVLSSLTVVLVYLSAKELAGKKAAAVVSLVYCLLPFPLTLTTVLTNQIPATFLIYLGIYIIISSKLRLNVYIRYTVFSVLAVISNVLRPEGIVPVLSVALFLVLTVKKDNIKKKSINLLIVILVYFVLFKAVSLLFKVTGMSPSGLVNNAPYWKFVLGFNQETGGAYSRSDAVVLGDNEAAYALVKERIMVPVNQLIELFKNKINAFWNSSTVLWSFGYAYSGLYLFGKTFEIVDFCALLEKINVFVMNMAYIFMIFGVFSYNRKKECNYNFLPFMNMVFVTFGVFLLIEVQQRYAYNIQPAVLILAALGVAKSAEWIKAKKQVI